MRLVQPQSAVELVTVGNPVAASKALALGLVDGLLEGDPKAAAVDYVTKALNAPLPIPLNMRSVEAISAEFWQTAHRTVSGRAKLEVAPLKALACLQQAATVDFETALAFERETFLALRGSTQATALRHVFFAERAAGRPCAYASITPRQVSSAAVIGGGTMGAGIAVALRDANLPVVLIERDNASVKKGIDTVRATYESAVKRGRISPDVAKQKVDGLIGSTDYGALANVDIVIEAVFEDLAIKQSVLKRLEAACRRDAVLATNTSYLNPNHIAVDLKSADRFMGLHFFSPANVMKLVEVVPAAATAPDVTATGLALARTLNKIPVLSGICDGFIGNRILKGMRMQAERLLLEGASPAEIDAAMRQFGYAMGPFEAQDLGGLDIAASQRRAARERGETFGIWVADRLVANGRLGQKTGGGWYDYVNGDRTPRTSTVVASYITDEANTLGIVQYQRSPEQLIDAVIGSMRLEAQKILNEGVAAHANDIDLVLIHGYGFPRWRGGLMHYANAQLT